MEGHGHEVAPGIHRIEAPLGDRYVACYLIVGDDAALLFDTGVDATPAASILPYCRSAAIDPARIAWIVVSHADVDHMGGDAAAKRLLPDAALIAHAADQRLIEDVGSIVEDRYREFRDGHGIDLDPSMIAWCHEVARAAPLDRAVDGQLALDLGARRVELRHTPGHSDGSVSIWDPRTRAFLSSDAVLGESVRRADGRPAFPPTYRRPAPYLASIEMVEELEPALLLAAHEPVMDAEAATDFLARSRAFARGLVEALLEVLAMGDRAWTTRELIDELAPRVGTWDRSAWTFLANGLVGHLEELDVEGVVTREPGPPTRWRMASGWAS